KSPPILIRPSPMEAQRRIPNGEHGSSKSQSAVPFPKYSKEISRSPRHKFNPRIRSIAPLAAVLRFADGVYGQVPVETECQHPHTETDDQCDNRNPVGR